MVKLRGPLFSLEASGSLANCLIYQTVNNLPVCRALTFPTYSRSDAQDDVRDTFSWACGIWVLLHDVKQEAWKNYVDYQGLYGRKAFMSTFLKRTYLGLWQFELPPDQGFCTTGNHNVGEFFVAGGFLIPVTD